MERERRVARQLSRWAPRALVGQMGAEEMRRGRPPARNRSQSARDRTPRFRAATRAPDGGLSARKLPVSWPRLVRPIRVHFHSFTLAFPHSCPALPSITHCGPRALRLEPGAWDLGFWPEIGIEIEIEIHAEAGVEIACETRAQDSRLSSRSRLRPSGRPISRLDLKSAPEPRDGNWNAN